MINHHFVKHHPWFIRLQLPRDGLAMPTVNKEFRNYPTSMGTEKHCRGQA